MSRLRLPKRATTSNWKISIDSFATPLKGTYWTKGWKNAMLVCGVFDDADTAFTSKVVGVGV
jgi:hypothetical protein